MFQVLILMLGDSRRAFGFHRLFSPKGCDRMAAVIVPALVIIFMLALDSALLKAESSTRPNIVLVMADDQGWGQTGYYDHPVLKTPNLDAMAENGLRLDRFYAAAPVCSPTRAAMLTGRTNMRTGVESHGYALRRQEKTLPSALRSAGYATAHFGKWHLNGLRGPGVPILKNDTHHPGVFGFDQWLSVSNFFDRDPIMSRQGVFEEFQGDSSEIIVEEALCFIETRAKANQPSLSVIWYGTPHSPFFADAQDAKPFAALNDSSRQHYGELVALDRSIGRLRAGLREAGIAENTLVWYSSDNGGLPRITPDTTGGLRGFKGSLYEGGLRVPSIIEWPAEIQSPRVSRFPAVTMDMFATIADVVGLPDEATLQPQDGISLRPLFKNEIARRDKPLVFNCFGDTAILDNGMKLLHTGKKKKQYEFYDLNVDPKEENNQFDPNNEDVARLRNEMDRFKISLKNSITGMDYPSGAVRDDEPEPRAWTDVDAYRPYFKQWSTRPEYRSLLKRFAE